MNRYMIIIGAFTTEEKVKAYAKQLEKDGYPSFIIEHSDAEIKPIKPPAPSKNKTTKQLYDEVMAGKHGSGEERKKSLGNRYEEVQDYINNLASSSRKTTKQLYDEVIAGKHGSGEARKKSLGNRYEEVQHYINTK